MVQHEEETNCAAFFNLIYCYIYEIKKLQNESFNRTR